MMEGNGGLPTKRVTRRREFVGRHKGGWGLHQLMHPFSPPGKALGVETSSAHVAVDLLFTVSFYFLDSILCGPFEAFCRICTNV